MNLCRRHLTDDQRAMIAARLVPHIEREQAERQTLSRIKVGEQRNPAGHNQHSKPKAGDASPAPGTKPCPPSTEGTSIAKRENSTRGKIAKQAGVSHHKADLAVRVTKAATKPEIEAVIAGKKKLAAVDREIKDRLGEKGSSPAKKKARKPVEHPFKPADDFQLDCLLAWTGLIEKKLGVTAKVRARGVFLEIFAAEEKSERGGTQSGEVNAPSKNLPVATSAPAAQDADDYSPDFDEPEPPMAKPDAKPAPTVKPKAAANKNGAVELLHPANLWGKPLPSRFGGSGT